MKIQKLAEACIKRAASLHGIKMIRISVMSEHVHCTVAVIMSISASKALQLLKGISARKNLLHQLALQI